MKAEPSNSVDFAEVDPPYGVRLDVHKAGTEHIETYHEWTEEEYKERLPIIVDELYRLLRDKTHAVLWFPSNYHDFVLAILKKSSFRLDKVASIWYKGVGNAPAPLYNLALDYEPFFMLRKGNAELAINDGQGNGQGRGHVFWRPADAEKYHSAEKPIDLILDILKTTVGSKPGTRLIVPFLGSGVTLRAAYKLEMNGFGWDSDEGNKIKFLKRVADDEKYDARVADE
jgi:DNA modification methylase